MRVGDQAGADTERVAHIEKALGLYHVEMKAGDALFFHSNVLHRLPVKYEQVNVEDKFSNNELWLAKPFVCPVGNDL